MKRNVSGWVLSLSLFLSAGVQASDYSFNLSEIEKKPYMFGGYAEFISAAYDYDKDTAGYSTRFRNEEPQDTAWSADARLRLNGSYEINDFNFAFISDISGYKEDTGDYRQITKFFEGYSSWSASPNFTLYAGKKNIKWGKGYAFSPAALIDRQKNPDDPEAVLEGHYLISADYIKNVGGALKNFTVTPVIYYINDDMNRSMSGADGKGYAGKLYLLLYDTDIDFMFTSVESDGIKYGFDFSKNLTSAFELHGEYAKFQDYKLYTPLGPSKETSDNYLIGVRYLTENEITFISEYYHRSDGYTENEMEKFYRADKAVLRNFAMQDYLYFRASVKEPFDVLYLTPALTLILNTDDGSFSASPEVTYTGFTNYELKLKATALSREKYTEYGEKPAAARIELRIRRYF
ncbi:MAG: hypothetical protein AB7E76_03220 [Deferribacterales bacterium]